MLCIDYMARFRGIESDERGYLITHDARYLENSDQDAIDQIVKRSEYSSLLLYLQIGLKSARLAELGPLLSERLRAFVPENGSLFKQVNLRKQLISLKAARERSLMNQVDSIIWTMIADEERSYRQRDFSYSRTAVEQLQNAIASMILVVVGVTIFCNMASSNVKCLHYKKSRELC